MMLLINRVLSIYLGNMACSYVKHAYFCASLCKTMENSKVTVYYYIYTYNSNLLWYFIDIIFRVIALDENVIRNSRIAGFFYRFESPSRCHIVHLNSYTAFWTFFLSQKGQNI